MINWMRYIVVGVVLLSLGGCFIPVGGGGYYRGGGDDDDSYQAAVNTPITAKVDWPQIYRGYSGPRYWTVPEQRSYVYRNNDRRDYYQHRRDERRPRDEDHRREDDD